MEKDDNLNIVLVGMPGAGKSYIGGKLAKLLVQFSYVDTDAEIEKDQGLSIAEIFDKHSENFFRELEAQKIKDISKNKNQIISIGGGAFQNPENVSALKENGLIFYLKASGKELFKRIEHESHRPLLETAFPRKEIENLLKKREKNYLKAHFVIDTEGQQAYTILDNILSEYEHYVR